ncbi:hypothetical protein [Candidatus Electronema sp. PJ]|uniref:hypothetical protein n=1 Tax=Candidatus Electronema sp. PJ TaxID=3401572 RepID=UPI003AA93B10
MKRIATGLIGGFVFGLMMVGAAAASEHERYEYDHGYAYGNGYVDNDDMYEHRRVIVPSYNNVVPTVPNIVMPTNPNIVYRNTRPTYNTHERYEHTGRYGYYDDDSYRRGYGDHD